MIIFHNLLSNRKTKPIKIIWCTYTLKALIKQHIVPFYLFAKRKKSNYRHIATQD